jgi:hypothetical protein
MKFYPLELDHLPDPNKSYHIEETYVYHRERQPIIYSKPA